MLTTILIIVAIAIAAILIYAATKPGSFRVQCTAAIGAPADKIFPMHGPQPYMAKLMSTFINCDKMVGSQFEEGLAKLKAIAER